MKILITGTAGFIGYHLANQLAKRGDEIVGIDNINDYYSTDLKFARLGSSGINVKEAALWNTEVLSTVYPNYRFIRMNLEDKQAIDNLFSIEKFDRVVHLAAQAGVRYSITNPYSYLQSNLVGFLNILEACRNNKIQHLVYASSSSVYGLNSKVPFSEEDAVDSPVSLYAASKKSNELMAHCYSKLYDLPTTGLRFFTVYGPWGRPDMAPMLFAKAILSQKPIDIFNEGNLSRDFTYVDDIVAGTIAAADHIPVAAKCPNEVPYKVYNIGCSNPVKLMDFILEIETSMEVTAIKNFLPMQPGDVYHTYADTSKLTNEVGYKPHVSLNEGVAAFIKWFKSTQNPLR